MNLRITSILVFSLSLASNLHAQPTSDSKEKESKYGEKTFAGLELRPLGLV